MPEKYILDACAVLVSVYDEPGADVVASVFDKCDEGYAEIYINKLNLLEVYYNVSRSLGIGKAEELYDKLRRSPVRIINGISDEVFRKAEQIKNRFKVSLADSIALAEAFVSGASILTSDHHEFDAVEEAEDISFAWIR